MRQPYNNIRTHRIGKLLDRDADEELDELGRVATVSPGKKRRRPFIKVCVNCGAYFQTPPSSKTRTCSKTCSSQHRSRKHLKKSNVWRDTSRAREAAARTGNLALGTPAARKSRKAGPFRSNVNARDWVVVDPDGNRFPVRNLRLWCEENGELFAPYSWRAAYAGLRQVAAWMRGATRRTVSQWRGWSLAGSL